jgi:hypothetical protein
MPTALTNKLKYFQQDEVALFVTHQEEVQPNVDQIKLLLDTSNRILSRLQSPARLNTQTRAVYTFPQVEEYEYDSQLDESRRPSVTPRKPSSIISVSVDNQQEESPTVFLETFKGLEKELKKELQDSQQTDLTVEAISLDWLGRISPEGSGSGGPGGWPVPYRGSPERAPFRFDILHDLVSSGNRGEGVDVIILDTVITPEHKNTAFDAEMNRHPLIRSLLRPDGPLHIELLPLPLSQHIKDLRSFGHDYEMSSHGVFVAGIVHTIAPCAQIYLVEVLNSYGVGDRDSIVWGLNYAIEHIKKNQGRLVVVNCSLGLDLPGDELHCLGIPPLDPCFPDLFTEQDHALDELICNQLKEDRGWIENQTGPLLTPCDTILQLKSQVISAAGNDHRPGQTVAPPARIPAAFDSVQGVGALPKALPRENGRLKKASYSNQADRPRKIGITALGGEEGEGQGVLGLYLGEFPCGEPNCTKWAWWSGTSFATPVVTGVTAAVLSNMNGADRKTERAIRRLYNPPKIVIDADVEQGEDGLSINQT